jgi:hypothetical protein
MAMAQAVSCRFLKVKSRVRSQASPREICGKKKWHRHRFFSEYFGLPCQVHCHNAPYSPSSTCCSYQKELLKKTGTIPKSSVLSEIGKHGIKNNCHFLVFKLLILSPPPYFVFPGGDDQQRRSPILGANIFYTYKLLTTSKMIKR